MSFMRLDDVISANTLGGNVATSDARMVVASKMRAGRDGKVHKVFHDWKRGFHAPIVCFIECMIVILYFALGHIHQHASVAFARDFAQVVDDFFMEGMAKKNEDEFYPQVIPLYMTEDFLEAAMRTARNLFAFADSIPFATEFNVSNHVTLDVSHLSGVRLQRNFTGNEMDDLLATLKLTCWDFNEVFLSSIYALSLNIYGLVDELLVSVNASFVLNEATNIIILDFAHTRVDTNPEILWQLGLKSAGLTIPLVIVGLAVVAIVLNIASLVGTWQRARVKAAAKFLHADDVFKEEVDIWVVCAFVAHSLSIIANVYYAMNGTQYESAVPPAMVIMGFAAATNCFLMCRYFKLYPASSVMMNVIWNGSTKVLQFLVGCAFLYAGYIVMGCCWFGSYDSMFTSTIATAKSLVCIVYGDNIKVTLDDGANGRDIGFIFSFIYIVVWVFFSLTVIFNISISIFEEAIHTEIMKSVQSERAKRGEAEIASNMLLPVDYKGIF